LSSLVTDERELAHQNHWGSVSSTSSSTHAGLDLICARAPPTWAAGGRSLWLFVRQATDGHGEMSIRLAPAKIQQWSKVFKILEFGAFCQYPKLTPGENPCPQVEPNPSRLPKRISPSSTSLYSIRPTPCLFVW